MDFDPATDVPDRASVPEEYRWDPSVLFASPEEWEREFERVEAAVEDLRSYEGRATEDGETLLEAIGTFYHLRERQGPLYAYARLRALQDTTDDDASDRLRRYERLKARIDDAAGYLEPAIQRAGRGRIERLVESTPDLEPYEHYLDDVLRRAAHTRSPAVESVLADLEPSLASPARVLAALKNDDFESPTVETPEGTEATVTTHTIGRLLEHDDRDFRRRVEEAYAAELRRHRHASARAFGDRIETNVRLARIRNYDDALAATLEGTLPESVYEGVVDGLRERLEPFHRHLELYGEVTDGETLRTWDLEVPITDGEAPTVTYDEAVDLVLDAVAPLGEDYRRRLATFLDGDRVDVFETTRKRSEMRGMNVPAHGAGSFVLLNYKNDLRSLYFFAHELGHAMHAELYQEAQPTVYADWPDHLVEIPSFLHEALLTRHLLTEWAGDPDRRGRVVETVLDKLPLRTGAHWSAFAREAHAVVEDGGQLTADRLDEIYGDLQATFLAPVDLRERDRERWLRQDLSRRPYFSYLYLIGMCGGLAVDRRLAEGRLDPKTYRSFLRAGSSEYPTDLLDRLGLDFAGRDPIAAAVSTYGDYVDELAGAVGT